MTDINFEYKQSSGVRESELLQVGQRLIPEIERVRRARDQGYDVDCAFINAPGDHAMIASVHQIINQKKQLQPSLLVLVGIGGSSLGAVAVYQALQDSLPGDIPMVCADTIDPDYVTKLARNVEQHLAAGKNIIVNVVSKSGTTLESVVNFEIFVALLKRYKHDSYHEYVVVTTDEGSLLWHRAQQEQIVCLPIPKNIGGRYSVLSPVGLFPLGLVGVDIDALCAGAQQALTKGLDSDLQVNHAALSALVLYIHYTQGKKIHDTFLNATDCAAVGAWYRQLMAESIGKEYDRSGGRVGIDMTPTVSMIPNDLHSVAQLYLAGQMSAVTTFISVNAREQNCSVPPVADPLVADIQGKSLAVIMHALERSVHDAYTAVGKPYVVWRLSEKNAIDIGQLLQYKMLEIMYLGFLLQVNPFDQPNVELYKEKMRKILAYE